MAGVWSADGEADGEGVEGMVDATERKNSSMNSRDFGSYYGIHLAGKPKPIN